MGSLFLKNCSDRARRVAYLSLCCMFHASLCTIQSKKGPYQFSFFGCLLPATGRDDIIVPLGIAMFPWAICTSYFMSARAVHPGPEGKCQYYDV